MTSWRRKREEQERAGQTRLPRCKATRKVSFPSEAAALARLDDLPVEGWRTYWCRWCGGVHLTSKPDYRAPAST